MRIRSITIGYGRTHSLPNYGNVKPSITLTADIDDGENWDLASKILNEIAETHVHNIIDDALEHAGESPRFYRGPLYQVVRWVECNAVIILPMHLPTEKLPGHWRRPVTGACRIEAARRRAERLIAEDLSQQLIDCQTGDVSPLLEWWDQQRFWRAYVLKTWSDYWTDRIGGVVCTRDTDEMDVPDELIQMYDTVGHSLREADLRAVLQRSVYSELPTFWCETQEQLDATLDAWEKSHPRPPEPAAEDEDDDTAERDYEPEEYDAEPDVDDEPYDDTDLSE